MKALFKPFILIAAAAMTFGSCTKDQSEDVAATGGYPMKFIVEPGTRTTLAPGDIIKWVEQDKAGVYVSNTSINRQATVDVTKNPVEFSVTLSAAPAAGDMLYAYYPYNGSAGNNLNAVKSSIPTKQTQSEAGVFAGSNNPLAGIPVALEAGADTNIKMPRVLFRQLGSIIEFGLMSSNPDYAAEQVKSISFTADKAVAGDFTFDITATGPDPVITGYTSASVTTEMTTPAALGTSQETASKIYTVVAPGQYKGTVEVTTDVAVYIFKITEAKDFKRATIKGLTVDLKNAVSREVLPFTLTSKSFGNSYSTEEQAFVLGGATIGYVSMMNNNSNNTPAGWAKEQVIQGKGNSGMIYNKTLLPIQKIRVYSVTTSLFRIFSGSAMNPTTNEVASSSLTPTRPTTKYINSSGNEATTQLYCYEFDLSQNVNLYFSINAGSSAVYYYKIEVDLGEETPIIMLADKDLSLSSTDIAEKSFTYDVYFGEPSTVSMTQDETSKSWLETSLDAATQKVTYKATSANTTAGDRTATLTLSITNGDPVAVTITQAKPAQKLTAPTVTSSDIKSAEFTLSWAAVANATKYGYMVMGGNNFSEEGETSNLSKTFTGLSPETEYEYLVWAIGDGVHYLDSEPANATVTTTSGGTGPAVGTVLWKETWDGGVANAIPSAYLAAPASKGTTVYGGATVTYASTVNTTKLYNEKTAGGTAPELLLAKGSGTWTITGIPITDVAKIQLSMQTNKELTTFTSITYSVDGGAATSFAQDSYTSNTLTTSAVNVTGSTMTIVFTGNTGSTNIRLDNISLVVAE